MKTKRFPSPTDWAFSLQLLASVASSGAPVPPAFSSGGGVGGGLLPPASIQLSAVPPSLPPGGNGTVIVQLVDSNGNPAAARNQTASISLFSSDPEVVSIAGQQQVITIPFGKSHAEVQVVAGIRGRATITATANGLNPGEVNITTSEFSDFALQLVPLENPASPGDTVEVRVGLLAAGKPFDTPAAVDVSLTASISGIAGQTVQVSPGNSFAYAGVTFPSSATSPFAYITAAASGFTSARSAVGLIPPG